MKRIGGCSKDFTGGDIVKTWVKSAAISFAMQSVGGGKSSSKTETSYGKSSGKYDTTADFLTNIENRNGKFYTDKATIDKNVLMEYLIDDFDCEKIYDSDEELITDAFFTLKHYASGEEEVSKDEWMYFLECLTGKREYNMEAKMSITTKPPHRQA